MAPTTATFTSASRTSPVTLLDDRSIDPSNATLTTIGATISVAVVVGAIVLAVLSWWVKRRRQQRIIRPPGWLSRGTNGNGGQDRGERGQDAKFGERDGALSNIHELDNPRTEYEQARLFASVELAERGDPQHLDSREIIPLRSELCAEVGQPSLGTDIDQNQREPEAVEPGKALSSLKQNSQSET